MLIIDSTPQTDALAEQLSSEGNFSEEARRAVLGVCALEDEVMQLRRMLAAMPAGAARDTVGHSELVRLLCKVVLFRVALPDGHALGAAARREDGQR